MVMEQWAQRWGVTPLALEELRYLLTGELACMRDPDSEAHSEKRAAADLLLEAEERQVRLWRNNSGAYEDARGVWVRYGLANESEKMNKVIKSPDYVGWRPLVVTPDMVGLRVGQCVLREVKAPGWKHNPKDKHEIAQMRFLTMAAADGCDASFCTGAGTL